MNPSPDPIPSSWPQLVLDPAWSWPIVVLVAAATLATVIGTYRRRIAHLPPRQRRTLLGLRLAAWALLVFMMFRPSLEFQEKDRRSSMLVVLTDHSRSMGIKDGSAGETRREASLKTLAGVEDELKLLTREVDLRQFEFDKVLTPVKERTPEATGTQTAIGYALDELLKQTQSRRVAGVILLSDGAQRALAPYDIDPRIAARRLADQQIPVHTIGFGTSGLSETSLDLIVEDLQVNPTVFVKNSVVVSAKVRALGAADKELTVSLKVEDPAGAAPGKPAPMKLATPPIKIRPTQNEQVIPVELAYIAQQPGEFKISVAVDPLKNEPVTSNNELTTFITVLKGGISVAYFDKIRPEQKFVRLIDESPDIQLDFKPIRTGKLADTNQLDPDWFKPGKYDVYIIGDVPAKVFGPELIARLARAVELGAGLMMTGGYHSFGGGGYGETPLSELLPVTMTPGELVVGDEVDPRLHYLQPLQMLPTTQGLNDFVMRLESSPVRNRDRWEGLAPLQGANKFTGLKPLGIVLAETKEHLPLLVRQEVGRARTLAFAADTTYQWVLAGQLEAHQQFWQQAILWLAHKEQQGDNSVWLKLESRRFRPGQKVELTFGARDVSNRAISDARFTIEVMGPKGETFQVTPERSGSDNVATFVETTTAGEYRVRVSATKDGKTLGSSTQSRFIVFEQDLELHNPAADFALLEEISRLTGGKHLPPEELKSFLHSMSGKLLSEVLKITRVTLWDNWPLLAIFVTVMSTEWYLRKRRGMV